MIYQIINKVLSQNTFYSRRRKKTAKILITEKKIMVKSLFTETWIKVNKKYNRINFSEKKINRQNLSSKHNVINKNKYSITSYYQNHNRKTIIKTLAQESKKGFYPRGTLYFDNTGSIQLNKNGSLCNELSLLMFVHKKTYIVKISGKVDQNLIEEVQGGVNLQDKKILPFKIKILEDYSKFLLLQEGRDRQIIRIVRCSGFKEADLTTIVIGSFSLDGLKEGDWKLIKAFNFEDIK